MTRQNGLGNLYFMTYDDIELKLRKIKLRDMSSYVISQMDTQVRSFIKQCQLDCVEKYLAVIGNQKAYFLVMQASPGFITLTEAMQRSDLITLHDKLSIMLLVCRAMSRIALNGAFCHHGHLHPNNVLVIICHSGEQINDEGKNY
jgi:hypothetical protein